MCCSVSASILMFFLIIHYFYRFWIVKSKEKESRFTYCPQYNSATVVPIDLDAVKKEEQLASTKRWQTSNGFIFPGKKTALESNIHPKTPGNARLDELIKVSLLLLSYRPTWSLLYLLYFCYYRSSCS